LDRVAYLDWLPLRINIGDEHAEVAFPRWPYCACEPANKDDFVAPAKRAEQQISRNRINGCALGAAYSLDERLLVCHDRIAAGI
jgi:hypothetical protein